MWGLWFIFERDNTFFYDDGNFQVEEMKLIMKRTKL